MITEPLFDIPIAVASFLAGRLGSRHQRRDHHHAAAVLDFAIDMRLRWRRIVFGNCHFRGPHVHI